MFLLVTFNFITNIIYIMGIGDWGLGIGPNPQSPIPNSVITISTIISIILLSQQYNIYTIIQYIFHYII